MVWQYIRDGQRRQDRTGQDRYEKHPTFCTVPSLNAYEFDFANDC